MMRRLKELEAGNSRLKKMYAEDSYSYLPEMVNKNPELERLSPAQKQLLRMGPKNVARLQKKLSDISRKLRVELEAS